MTWKIDKQIDFCYGHRVWSQELNAKYSLDSCHACRHLHGHQGVIKVHLEGESLQAGMVTDFKHLNSFKKFIDDYLDHKFIIDRNDPAIEMMIPNWNYVSNVFLQKHPEYAENLSTVNTILYQGDFGLDQHTKEILESYVIVDFVPTSENLTQWLFHIVNNHLQDLEGYGTIWWVSEVEFWETPKSHCSYKE